MKVTVGQRQDDKVHTDRASVDRGPDDSALQFRRSALPGVVTVVAAWMLDPASFQPALSSARQAAMSIRPSGNGLGCHDRCTPSEPADSRRHGHQ